MSGHSHLGPRTPGLRIAATAAAVALLALTAGTARAPIDHPSVSTASRGNAMPGPSAGHGGSTATIQEAYAKLPLSFEANVGQIDSGVEFVARGRGYTLFLTRGDAVLALRPRETSVSALRMRVVGGNASAQAAPQEPLAGNANYFIGSDPTRWHVGVPTYGRISYAEIYPGVDLFYYGDNGRLEYDFVVGPGADPSVIAVDYDGAQKVEIDARGNLLLGRGAQEILQTKPVVYQEVGGERTAVAGAYVLRADGAIGFEVGSYDTTRALFIDPTLVYSTYLGGTLNDEGNGIAVDASGSAYVTGATSSTNFPTTLGAEQTTASGGGDAFVMKLNPAGNALVYSSYLGGSGGDTSHGIAVDAFGSAYVTGATTSTNFPTTPGAVQTTAGGAKDAFVTKLNPAGNALAYSSYLGGSGLDEALSIAVDSTDSAYLAGLTDSLNFPTTPGAFDTAVANMDAFVTKFNPTGTALLYSSVLGGSGTDAASGIAVDSAGNAYVTGQTVGGFPTTAGAFQTTYSGFLTDAFVTKLNSTGSALVYSTYLGGDFEDSGVDVALDSLSNAYVTGFTGSTNFPTTPGAFATTGVNSPTFYNAFVTKLNPTGNALVYSTYLGGTNADAGSGIAVDSSFNAHVTGTTSSTDFPTQDALQPTNGGGIQDAFVTKVNPSGSALVYSTYLGGSGDDRGSRIAVDSSSDAYVAGATSSTNFPTTPGTFQASNGGQADGFLSKIRDVGPPATLTLAPAAATNTLGTSHTITATVRDAAGRPVPSIVVRFTVTGAHSVSGSCTTGSNGQCTFAYTGTVAGTDAISAYADSDNDNVRDVGEPIGTAAKVWTAPTPGCPPNGGDDDRDNDGLEDNDEGVFGTQVVLADSDGDGILDGNEDSDHDGVADEDEDDGTDGECPNDSDGDGVDDEDEDDHPVGFAQVLDELGPDIASVETDRTGAA